MCKRRHHTIGEARWQIFLRGGWAKKPVENRFVSLDKRCWLPETSAFP